MRRGYRRLLSIPGDPRHVPSLPQAPSADQGQLCDCCDHYLHRALLWTADAAPTHPSLVADVVAHD